MSIKDKLKGWWDSLKSWFKYSWSIFLARSEIFVGVAVAAISSLDFTPLLSGIQTGLTFTQGVTIGGLLVLKGIISELGRRAGTVELSSGQLVPATVDNKSEAIAAIKAVP